MEFIAMLNRDSINNLVEGDRIALTFCLGNLYMRRNLFAWQICFFFHLKKCFGFKIGLEHFYACSIVEWNFDIFSLSRSDLWFFSCCFNLNLFPSWKIGSLFALNESLFINAGFSGKTFDNVRCFFSPGFRLLPMKYRYWMKKIHVWMITIDF